MQTREAGVMESRPDLERRLLSSLSIAEKAIPVLAVAPPEDLETPPSFKREKFICETALLLYAAFGPAQQSPRIKAAFEVVASALVPHARSDALLAMMRLRPSAAIELCV